MAPTVSTGRIDGGTTLIIPVTLIRGLGIRAGNGTGAVRVQRPKVALRECIWTRSVLRAPDVGNYQPLKQAESTLPIIAIDSAAASVTPISKTICEG